MNGKMAIVGIVIVVFLGCAYYLSNRSKGQQQASTAQEQSAATTATGANMQHASPASQAPATAAAPTSQDTCVLTDVELGATYQQVADVVAEKGFPDADCKAVGGGFKDCVTRKGEPGQSNFESYELSFSKGKLYAAKYFFSGDRYAKVSKELEGQYGTPERTAGGVEGWKLGSKYRQVILKPGADGQSPMAALVDVQEFANRRVEDAVNGRGQFAR